MHLSKAAKKYFDQYAEEEIQLLFSDPRYQKTKSKLCSEKYDRVVVIPAYDERKNLPTIFESILNASKSSRLNVLVVLVLNERLDSEESVKLEGKLALEEITNKLEDKELEPPFLYGNLYGLRTLVINRTGDYAFPEDQGVGLARKIGCDMAAFLIEVQRLIAFSFIYTTDADASVPLDYFEPPKELKKKERSYSLLFHSYKHRALADATDQEIYAMNSYEKYLHFYADSLKKAGSPYGVQTVGSCLAFRAESYLQVRGFPRRNAGEDFYLVNKLLKVGKYIDATCGPIILQGRVSFRVPFGTGASIGQISAARVQGKNYEIYDPRCFKVLESVLNAAYYCLNDSQSGVEGFSPQVSEQEKQVVEIFGFEKALLRSKRASSKNEMRKKSFDDWFDAFKTLKFVHLLRDQLYPSKAFEKVMSSHSIV